MIAVTRKETGQTRHGIFASLVGCAATPDTLADDSPRPRRRNEICSQEPAACRKNRMEQIGSRGKKTRQTRPAFPAPRVLLGALTNISTGAPYCQAKDGGGSEMKPVLGYGASR